MLRDNVKKYYLEQDYNCAETILRCIDEEYGIGLTEDDFKLVSAFGGAWDAAPLAVHYAAQWQRWDADGKDPCPCNRWF